jgi:hypothetical protein
MRMVFEENYNNEKSGEGTYDLYDAQLMWLRHSQAIFTKFSAF